MTATAQDSRQQALRDRKAERVASARRRKIVRNLLIFVVAMTIMVYLSILNRDHQARAADQERMGYWREQLVEARANGDQAPVDLPIPPGDKPSVRGSFVYHSTYDLLHLQRQGPVAVVYREKPVGFFLRESGRHVLIFDGTGFRIEWIPESQIEQRAATLGIRRTGAKPTQHQASE